MVGATGSGKTTLVDLILGLLTPSGGRILIDDQDLGEHTRAWQRQVGYVPQDIYLMDDTIRRNVAFGIKDSDIDDAAVNRAIEAAQLSSFIESLPNGLDTTVGERGIRLSGGQRQRIGIARALYHEPEVLVLDEATSSLDTETERFVMQAVERLRQTRTIILIAHRMSTVRGCDRLFYLSDGRVLASGAFDNLLAENERFKTMVGAD
jgi:ABC-type multidrug transport system fused ATPase/permease subunit